MSSNPLYLIADRLAAKLRAAFLQAIAEIRARSTYAVLTAAIDSGDLVAILNAVQVARLSTALLPAVDLLEQIVTQTAAQALTDVTEIAIKASFTLVNPFAAVAAQQQGALLVTRITTETQLAIRALVARAVTEGIAPRELATLIQPLIGLTTRQTQAVLNARAVWGAAGLTDDALTKRVETYSAKLLKQRAVMIARTETIAAANQGQRAAWRAAVQQGLLNPDRTFRIWSAASDQRVCPICEGLDEQIVGFDEPFVTIDGVHLDAPPAHPSCRCSVALTFEKKKRTAA